ncbi:type 1 glutamine amidotransferase domain-containing protein [Puerhibacterium puerhi]|uniref:type 1 glutamine amidotransferase domain-containing protein n=1 Tax=Puerhibacterium puerhi TaxID=2692623 RepID=UPI001356A444|nr:type 1 glutamine amidotransferase domain-containing protein [Puerhibacterium puerhi]
MAGSRRVLIVATNAHRFERVGFRTGLWLSELTHFWDVVEDAGFAMDIASPSGGKVPLDPESLLLTEMGSAVGVKGQLAKRYEDPDFMRLLDATTAVADVDAAQYDAIYLTGGHGVMFDFRDSPLAELVARFYDAGRVVSAVCHGPCGLLDVQLGSGGALVDGKQVTGYSWTEEVAARRNDAVPFSLEEELQRRGGRYSKSKVPFRSHVVEDGRLITGQNPRSAPDVAEAVVKMLNATTDQSPSRSTTLGE